MSIFFAFLVNIWFFAFLAQFYLSIDLHDLEMDVSNS